MNISDISAAKHLKFQLKNDDAASLFKVGDLLHIQETGKVRQFTVIPYGGDRAESEEYFMYASQEIAAYLIDLLMGEKQGFYITMFAVEEVDTDRIGVQAYRLDCQAEYAILADGMHINN